VGVLGAYPNSSEVHRLREEIRSSPRVQRLQSEREEDGRIPFHPYAKWSAPIGSCPAWQTSAVRLATPSLFRYASRSVPGFSAGATRGALPPRKGTPSTISWQWASPLTGQASGPSTLSNGNGPMGRGNCDKNPGAINSSLVESLIPLRGLARNAKINGDARSKDAAQQGAEVSLKRRLFRTQADGCTIHDDLNAALPLSLAL
jgi:hypothetical protein